MGHDPERQFKLSDGGWLFLVVMPSGLKLWRRSASDRRRSR